MNAFYRELHPEALSYEGMSDEEILFSDYKEYEVNGVRFGIGLASAVDEDHARALAERMKEALPLGYEKVDVDLMFASVGVREGNVKTDFVVPSKGYPRFILRRCSRITTSTTALPISSGTAGWGEKRYLCRD